MSDVKDMTSLELKLSSYATGEGGEGSKLRDGQEVEKNAVAMEEMREFYCRYCRKKFSNCQALGGHQNAHKRERGPKKKEKTEETVLAEMASGLYPPSTLLLRNSHFSSLNRRLRVHIQSTIHKPSNSRSHHGLGYGYGGTGGAGGWSSYCNRNRQLPTVQQHAAPPPPSWTRAFDLGGTTAFRPPFEGTSWQVGSSSRTADNRSGSSDHLPGGAVPEEVHPEIDLTLRL